MACPFAFFARSLSEEHVEMAGPSSSITAQLKSGTWQAHREIEKSVGVRALMGSHYAESNVRFDRMDHLRFLIMLACVYVTMENVLLNQETALSNIMPLLLRSDALLDDIQAHLNEILYTPNASICDLDQNVEEGAEEYHGRIVAGLKVAQANLQSKQAIQNTSSLTSDHIALLTKRQSIAVQSYMNRMFSLPAASSNRSSAQGGHYDEGISFTPVHSSSPISTPGREVDSFPKSFLSLSAAAAASSSSYIDNTTTPTDYTILAHAYVRYMGDLSGGQHIVKRLSKLFPIHNGDNCQHQGFKFYSFTSTRKEDNNLKETIRIRIDELGIDQKAINVLVDEASLAFRLNGMLFDSLVDEDSTAAFTTSSSSSLSSSIAHPMMLSAPLFSKHSLRMLSIILLHPHTIAFLTACLFSVGLASTLYTQLL